jgi:S-adenosylmethionine synthetase
MPTSRHLFTSESVTEGHPDKICDQISDAILDAFLTQDPMARVAAETVVNTGLVMVTGEITSSTYVDISGVVRRVVQEIGYTGLNSGGFDGATCGILLSIDEQSADIAGGVNVATEVRSTPTLTHDEMDKIGAGDQGLMFGYACNETPELMPLPIALAHQLVHRLAQVRKDGTLAYLRPDGKSQVTVEYVAGKPVRIDTIVISTQHNPTIGDIEDNDQVQARIQADIRQHVIEPVFAGCAVQPDGDTHFFINPSGRFVIGGPQGDSGLTGRKIIVDTYGGYARHGGGAFSGKDPTKVDRSAAYAARYVAKHVVAAGLADKCEVQLSYAIGVAKPTSILVDTFGTAEVGLNDDLLAQVVRKVFDLRPAAIIQQFALRTLPAQNGGSFYRHLAAYGHIGRTDIQTPWETLDRLDQVKQEARALQGKPSATKASEPALV